MSSDHSLSSIQIRIQNYLHSKNLLRSRIGNQPQYIQPKISVNSPSQPDIISESQFNSSSNVPKFHSPTLIESVAPEKIAFKNKKFEITEEFTEPSHERQINLSGPFPFLSTIIWILYLIGSVDTSNEKFSPFHIFDIIGNGVAIFQITFVIYLKKSLNSFCEVLHIWSILFTVAFLSYSINESSSDFDKFFVKIICVLRCLRLGFPVFMIENPFSIIRRGCQITIKSRKIVGFALVFCFLLGFFWYQIFSDALGNRCRLNEFPEGLDNWQAIDDRLCGQRVCPTNSFCRNPKVFRYKAFKQQEEQKLLQWRSIYSFDSSWLSAVSIFEMFTLNSWGRISEMYFDVFTGWISVPFFLIGFILFEKLLLSLNVIFFDILKQKREQFNLMTGSVKKSQSNNLQIKQNEDLNDELDHTKIKKTKSVRFINNLCQQTVVSEDNEEKTRNKTKIALYLLWISFSFVHFFLASQFGLHPSQTSDDLLNRKIGIYLSILFIVNLIALLLAKYQFLEPEQDEYQSMTQTNNILIDKHQGEMSQKQVIETVKTLQFFIVSFCLADYILRLVEGKYILEETSGLTGLVHFALSLRLYYILLVLIDIFDIKALKNHLVTVVRTFKSVFRYSISIVAIASLIGTISYIINKEKDGKSRQEIVLVFEINRFLMFLMNHSWQNLFKFQISGEHVHQESLFVEIMGAICLVFGSIVFVRYIISRIVHQSFVQSSANGKNSCQDLITKQNLNKSMKKSLLKKSTSAKSYKYFPTKQPQDDQTAILKRQKSFFILDYNTRLRQFLLQVVKDEQYQNKIKFRFYIFYVTANLICCLLFSSQIYGIISAVLEGFVLIDIILSALALRMFGDYSYTENKLIKIAHFSFCFAVIILALIHQKLQIVVLMQTLRIFVILSYFQGFEKTFSFVESIYKTIFLHLLILIPLFLGYALIMILLMSAKSQNDSFIFKLVKGLKFAVILVCQKGWDLTLILGNQNQSTLFGQLTLFTILLIWVACILSLLYSLSGIILSQLIMVKTESENKRKKELCNSNDLLEQEKIKQKIRRIKPKFNAQIHSSGFWLKIIQNRYFQFTKKTCVVCSIICFLVLNTSLSTDQRIILYAIHLFLFTLEVLFFTIESISFDKNQDNFSRDFLLNLIAIPGAYIGFVNPIQYSTQSFELKIILLLFNALTTFRFIKIINYFPILLKICTFLRQNMSQTLNTSSCILVFTVGVGFYIYKLLDAKEQIIQCTNYAFVGLIGGDFNFAVQKLIQRNSVSLSYEIHFLYVMVHILNIFLRNLLIAYAIYELSNFAGQQMPISNTLLTLYNFNKFFHENEFIEEWMQIDPEGKGFVNYRLILYKSHKFIRHFSIEATTYKNYFNRLQTFRKLKIPIYQCQTTIEIQDCSKPELRKEYVISVYDFLFELTRFAFKEMNSNRLINKGKYFIQDESLSSQPVSIINIGSNNDIKSNLSKNNPLLESKIAQISAQWTKKSYDQLKKNIQQKLESNLNIEGVNFILRATKYNSQELYFAHRSKNKISKFLKSVKKKNEMKKNEKAIKFKNKA